MVGGRAALLLAVLFACDIAAPRPPAVDPTNDPSRSSAAADAPRTSEGAPEAAGVLASPPAVDAPSAVTFAASREVPRVVLVTIDGLRWEDFFAVSTTRTSADEPMPNLRRLVRDRGIALGGPGCTYDVRASGPNFVSLPGYIEMFTGKASGCFHNACPPVTVPTVIDEVRAASGEADVAVFASWEKYAHAVARDRKSIVLSAGARTASSGLARDDTKLRGYLDAGAAHAGYPGWGDYRPDVHTARIALRYLETMRPRLLVVGLGDADEQAHRGDFAGYERAVRSADEFIADVERALARMGEEGSRTAVLVTTDHGRAHSLRAHGAAFPESQRVFVAGFGAGVAHRGIACSTAPIRLAHLAGALRSLLSMESAAGH
ncbi:MAG TPA: hypothetical protein VM925_06940, partial [Labilithrix sp.]|nr:hypothetical protein [Labilithrix sp.]